MKDQKAICINCVNCELPNMQTLMFSYICKAFPVTESMNFVTGEVFKDPVLCASKNVDGTCEKFVPKG